MARFHGIAWLQYVPGIALIVFFPFQAGNAQTVEDFLAKDEQEQRRIIDNIVPGEIQRLTARSVEGRPKSQDELSRDRRLANYIRSSYTHYGIRKASPDSKVEPEGIDNLRMIARMFKRKYASTSMRDFFIERASTAYEITYTNSKGLWKKNFDSKTDRQQVADFRAERDRIKREANKAVVAGLDSQIARLKSQKKAAEEQIRKNDEELRGIETERKDLDEILSVMRIEMLELDTRPSKSDSNVTVLVFRNAKEKSVSFDLRCYRKNNEVKTKAVSVPANGEAEIAFLQSGEFILGNRCEFHHQGKVVRRFTLPED